MKKLLLGISVACMLVLIATACGQSNRFDEKSVSHYTEMIASGQTLSQEDYAAMTDIMEDAYSQIIPDTKEVLMLSAKAATNDKDAIAELERKTAEIEKKYSDLKPIMECLMGGTPEQMGEATYKRFHRMVEDGQKTVEDYTKEIISGGIGQPRKAS